jgi:hypothetical protein
VSVRLLSYVYFLPYAWAFLTFWLLRFPAHPHPALRIVTGLVAVFLLYRLLMGYRGEKLARWHLLPLPILWSVVRQEIWSSAAFRYRFEVPEAPGYATCSFPAASAVIFFSYLCILSSLALFADPLRRCLQRAELDIVRLR